MEPQMNEIFMISTKLLILGSISCGSNCRMWTTELHEGKIAKKSTSAPVSISKLNGLELKLPSKIRFLIMDLRTFHYNNFFCSLGIPVPDGLCISSFGEWFNKISHDCFSALFYAWTWYFYFKMDWLMVRIVEYSWMYRSLKSWKILRI